MNKKIQNVHQSRIHRSQRKIALTLFIVQHSTLSVVNLSAQLHAGSVNRERLL